MPSLFKRLFSRMPMARSTRAYEFALEHLTLPPHAPVLDLGTGPGLGSAYPSRRLPQAQVVTLDITVACLQRHQLQFGPNPPFFIQATAPQLPLATGSTDAVLAVMTFHCLPQPQQVIAEAARVLRPGGSLLIADVDGHHWMARPFEWVEHLAISPLTHAYTAEELRAMTAAVGLGDFAIYRRPGKQRGFMMWVVARKVADVP